MTTKFRRISIISINATCGRAQIGQIICTPLAITDVSTARECITMSVLDSEIAWWGIPSGGRDRCRDRKGDGKGRDECNSKHFELNLER